MNFYLNINGTHSAYLGISVMGMATTPEQLGNLAARLSGTEVPWEPLLSPTLPGHLTVSRESGRVTVEENLPLCMRGCDDEMYRVTFTERQAQEMGAWMAGVLRDGGRGSFELGGLEEIAD